jgi:hypothetical protein
MAKFHLEDADRQQADAAAGDEAAGEDSPLISGLEINLGDFTRTQGLMKSLRLTLNQQIVVQVEELASGVSEAGRKFKLGDIEQANQDVARLYSAFGQRTGQWESQARQLEQQMKMQAAKNPKSISIERMNQMKSEQTAVRTRIRTADVQFRRLHQGLDQAFTNLQCQAAPAAANAPADLPAGFLDSFKTAMPADRPALVKEHCAIETVLQADVSRGTTARYDIRFNPLPPLGRVYYLTKTAQLVRLNQLGDVVSAVDLETAQEIGMKLVDFVKQVQAGAWLLK